MNCLHEDVKDVTTPEEHLDGIVHSMCQNPNCLAEIIESRIEGWYEEFIPNLDLKIPLEFEGVGDG
jgi:hypothetical protein